MMMGPRLRVAHVREEYPRAIVEHGKVRGARSVRYCLADDLEVPLAIEHPKGKRLALDMSVGVDDVGDGPSGSAGDPTQCWTHGCGVSQLGCGLVLSSLVLVRVSVAGSNCTAWM